MKKLPIGISTLVSMQQANYLYIDKTHHLAKMIATGGKYFFLSRPRRFGKSLLVDTIKQAFLGNKALFHGLYLENKWDWNQTYPVIHLDFGGGNVQTLKDLEGKINELLDTHYEQYEITNTYQEVSSRFSDLIRKLEKKFNQRVVVLVDEYDKPILDNISHTNIAKAMREALKNLYSVIKTKDAELQFVLLTGVSKFSKVSLFSGLNNLDDISLDPRYADICGYTQKEMEKAFSDYLTKGKVDLKTLKAWYNGYNFAGLEEQKVYNPYDLLLFCAKGYQYSNYWFETATPSFLIKFIETKQCFIPQFDNVTLPSNDLSSFEIENLDIYTLLFQAGYLTIKKITTIGALYAYQLSYPNIEVKMSLNNALLSIGTGNITKSKGLSALNQIIHDANFDDLKTVFNTHFASIPHDWYRKNPIGQYEGFYASVVYSYFAALGYDLMPEETMSSGQIDLTLKTIDKIIIIEFKLTKHGNANDALKQMKEKGYANKFSSDNRTKFLIGISFDISSKSIDSLAWEQH